MLSWLATLYVALIARETHILARFHLRLQVVVFLLRFTLRRCVRQAGGAKGDTATRDRRDRPSGLLAEPSGVTE